MHEDTDERQGYQGPHEGDPDGRGVGTDEFNEEGGGRKPCGREEDEQDSVEVSESFSPHASMVSNAWISDEDLGASAEGVRHDIMTVHSGVAQW